MKVIQLNIKNVMGIIDVEIIPQGNTIIISGPNAAGKTSALNSMWLALTGKEAMKANPDPVRHGEDHAEVVVNLGDFIVTRTWTRTRTNLLIRNAEGAVFNGPQAMLASFIGKLTFDPQAFTELTQKEQVGTLMSLVNLPIDLNELDLKRKTKYEARTIVNRDVAKLTSQVDAIPINTDVPDDELNTADVLADMQAASDLIAENTKIRDALRLAELRKEASERDIIETKEQLLRDEEELAGYVQEISTLSSQVEGMVDPDLESFTVRLAEVEKINELVRKKHERDDTYAQLQIARSESTQITVDIKDIDTLKATTIQEADMPVEGLGFNEDGVTYNDTLLTSCSSAEQLRVSMAIAMAMNPKLRVIRIANGSLLDSANMKLIEEMAQDHDYQVWVEKVDETGELGICIEEGRVASDNQVKDDSQRAVEDLEQRQEEIDQGAFDDDTPPEDTTEGPKKEMPPLPKPGET